MTLIRTEKLLALSRHNFMKTLVILLLIVFLFIYYNSFKNKKATSDTIKKFSLSTGYISQSSSFICDDQSENRFLFSTTNEFNLTFNTYRQHFLNKYCDIVPTPMKNWVKPKSYDESDVVFVIFTGLGFYQSRAMATRDTWLSRVTNYHFLSATEYPYLPITVVKNAGEDRLSNMKKIFYGLKVIYDQQIKLPAEKRQKWFYIAGCDTFIIPEHLLKRLDDLDYRKPLFIGGHSGPVKCLDKDNTKTVVQFASGGAGFFLSFKLLEMLQPHLIDFVENRWPNSSDISDVAMACLINHVGVKLLRKEGFWAHPPDFTYNENGRKRFHADQEPNDFHYIKPDEMHALDEFYVHQRLDRLIADRNWEEYVEFTRRFVVSHYEILRRKRRECTLPVVPSS